MYWTSFVAWAQAGERLDFYNAHLDKSFSDFIVWG